MENRLAKSLPSFWIALIWTIPATMKLKMRWPQRKNWSSAASNLVTTRSRGRTQLPMQTSLLAWLTPLTLIIQTTLIRSYLSTSPCWVAQTTQSH